MKIKVKDLLGVVTNENESILSGETSSLLTGTLTKKHIEAKDYVVECFGGIKYKHFQEIILDQDRFNVVKKDNNFTNEYVYDPQYFYLSIVGNTINLHRKHSE